MKISCPTLNKWINDKELQNSERYIRVGTTLYKIVRRPRRNGDDVEDKIVWNYETLRQDYGKNNLPENEKYDVIPDHINYCQVFGTNLNQNESNTSKTTFLRFLKMIFGKNATLYNEDSLSQCNADWTNRLLILVDELLLNKKEDILKSVGKILMRFLL